MSQPLTDAARAGDSAAVQQLLPTASPADRLEALRAAVRREHLDVVRMMLASGVDPNQRLPDGDAVLLDAAVAGHAEVAKMLLDAGAQLETPDSRTGTTALLEASRFGNAAVVELLLQHGANKDAVDADGHNAQTLALSNLHDATAQVCARAGIPSQPQFAAELQETRQGIAAAMEQMR